MTPPTALIDYKDKARETPVLGYVCIFSVRDFTISHTDLSRRLADHNLSGYEGKKPADVDVWRRVCTAAQRKRMETDDENVYLNILLRDVTSAEKDVVLKRIVAERVNAKGRLLQYDQVFDVVFHRTSASMRVTPLLPVVDHPEAAAVAGEIAREYARLRGTVNGDGLRTMTRRIIEEADGILLRATGGAWFVPWASREKVENLDRFAQTLSPFELDLIPLVDSVRQRAMVRNAIEADSVQSVDALIKEMGELVRTNGTVSDAKVTAFVAQYQQLSKRAEAYGTLLEDSLEATRTRLELMQRHMRTLLGRVGDDGAASGAAA